MRYIADIDIEKYRCVVPEIRTSRVMITDVQIAHIQERHPDAFLEFEKYAGSVLDDPDYILQNRPNTVLLLKEIVEVDKKFQLVLRLCIPGDPTDFSNSVITFTRVREKEWGRLLRNKNILYKKG